MNCKFLKHGAAFATLAICHLASPIAAPAQTAPVLFPLNSLFGGAAYGKTIQISAANTFISDGQNLWAGTYQNVPWPGTNPVVWLYPNDYLLNVPGVVKPARFRVYPTDVGTNIVNVASRLTSGPLFYFGTNGIANLIASNGIVFYTNADGSVSIAANTTPGITNGGSAYLSGTLLITNDFPDNNFNNDGTLVCGVWVPQLGQYAGGWMAWGTPGGASGWQLAPEMYGEPGTQSVQTGVPGESTSCEIYNYNAHVKSLGNPDSDRIGVGVNFLFGSGGADGGITECLTRVNPNSPVASQGVANLADCIRWDGNNCVQVGVLPGSEHGTWRVGKARLEIRNGGDTSVPACYLDSGLTSTPVAGAIERDASALYFTTDDGARHNLLSASGGSNPTLNTITTSANAQTILDFSQNQSFVYWFNGVGSSPYIDIYYSGGNLIYNFDNAGGNVNLAFNGHPTFEANNKDISFSCDLGLTFPLTLKATSGYVGVGTPTPVCALDVNGPARFASITNQSVPVPAVQSGTTNVSLAAATSVRVNFKFPMPSTNYTAVLTANGAAISGLSITNQTTTNLSASISSLTYTGRILYTVVQVQ